MSKKANIIVMTAPSGTGKTTLTRRLLSEHETVKTPTSLTTRPQRPNEKDGDHYHFVSVQEFEAAIQQEKFLEWAKVFENYYGTSYEDFDNLTAHAEQVLLEIDVQGWQQIKRRVPESIGVFIMPPSLEDLWQRLSGRGTEALQTRWLRLQEAHDELLSVSSYDAFIINVDIDAAYKDMENLVISRKIPQLDKDSAIQHAEKLLAEYESAPWIQDLRSKFENQ